MITIADDFLDNVDKKSEGLFDFILERVAASSSTSYIYNTKAHFIISLYIKEQAGYAHYESICSNIPKNIASRATIQSILDMGVKLNIYTKLTYPNDKRVKLYNLSVFASNEIERFFSDFLEITNRKKSK